MNTATDTRLARNLLITRLALAAFMAVWVADKFVNAEHTARVFEHFYFIDLPVNFAWIFGLVQLVVLVAFTLGAFRTISYGLMLAMHTVSTVTPLQNYLSPYEGANILFFAAIPVWAAFWFLFSLRDEDEYSFDAMRQRSQIAS